MYGPLSIPCSNADSERAFSMLRKIHTDHRSNLEQSTIVSLMSMKFNCDDCCHDSNFSSELLTVQESHNCGTQHKSTFIVHINNHDATISINYNYVIIIILYVKWVESVGVSKGVWFVPTFLFLKLATMILSLYTGIGIGTSTVVRYTVDVRYWERPLTEILLVLLLIWPFASIHT